MKNYGNLNALFHQGWLNNGWANIEDFVISKIDKKRGKIKISTNRKCSQFKKSVNSYSRDNREEIALTLLKIDLHLLMFYAKHTDRQSFVIGGYSPESKCLMREWIPIKTK